MNNLKLIIVFVLLIMQSCNRFAHLENINRNFILSTSTNEMIRNDGYYKGNGFNYLIFTNNNKVVRTNSAIDESLDKFLFNYEKEDLIYSSYIIEGNIIKAYLGTVIKRDRIVHSGNETVYLNYEGVIKNKDTIINWKPVEPIPKLNKTEQLINKKKFEPHTLYFVKTDAVKCLKMD